MEIVAVAGGAALLSISAIVGLIVLSLKLSAAKDAQTTSAVDAADLKGRLAIAQATIATKTNEADSERTRANALDDALAQAEQQMESDPRGALGRLLSHWKTAPGSAAVSGASAVRPTPPAAGTGDARDALLRPGE